MRYFHFLIVFVLVLAHVTLDSYVAGRRTTVSETDGITLIKAFQEKASRRVTVKILYRPPNNKSLTIFWQSVDSHNRKQMHTSILKEVPVLSTQIEVSPGSEIKNILITGYDYSHVNVAPTSSSASQSIADLISFR